MGIPNGDAASAPVVKNERTRGLLKLEKLHLTLGTQKERFVVSLTFMTEKLRSLKRWPIADPFTKRTNHLTLRGDLNA